MDSSKGCRLSEISQDCLLDVSQNHFDLKDSSFFKVAGRELPSPTTFNASARGINVFTDLQLLVKSGKKVTIDEAVTIWAIKKNFGHLLPVPELFGWRVHLGTVFIYMELIPGVTLKDRWHGMTTPEKESICKELRQMLLSLRKVSPKENIIGSITGGPLLDRVFHDKPKAGPFRTIEEFYDWLEWLPQRRLALS